MKSGRKQDSSPSSSQPIKRGLLPLLIVLFTACSGHGIYIVHDPLSAGEHNDLAVAYEERGEYDLAIDHLDRAIWKDPGNPLFFTNRGNVLLKRGDETEALKDFEKAIEIDPDYLDAINNLCFVRASRGRPLLSCPDLMREQLEKRRELPWQFLDTAGLVLKSMDAPGMPIETFRDAISRCAGCSKEQLAWLKERVKSLEDRCPK